MTSENLKWQKILWTFVSVTAIYLLFLIIVERSDGKFGSYPYMIFGWWIAIITGVLVLALRLIKVITDGNSFFYIFIGTFNLLMGVLDIYFMVIGTEVTFKWKFIGALPVILSIIIYTDILKVKAKAS